MAQGEASEAVVGRLGAPGVVVDGRYRLERMLGAGGFGEVWSAVQEVEGAEVRPVALKLVNVPDSVSEDSSGGSVRRSTGRRTGSRESHRSGGSHGSVGGQRWLDEVRAVRDIRCDAITTIFDVGIAREPRVGFIAMELLRGETLDDLLARRARVAPRGEAGVQALYWRRSLAIARDVARALVACHAVGVVHCDLKPQNIFLDAPRDASAAASRVYVLDFGIASLGEAVRAQAEAVPSKKGPGLFEMGATGAVTISDMPELGVPAGAEIHVFGTPGYIAPENFRGDAPGPASDVFALGVLLYQMISGRLPHRVGASLLSGASGNSGNAANELPKASPDSGNSVESARRYQAALSAATVAGDFDPLDIATSGCPAGVRDLIEKLLDPEPENRPVAGLLEEIERVWRCPHGVPDPPYVGLAAFDASRAGYIAGRDADIDELAAALEQGRVVVLAGPSGCGKSSLALAGVAARVDEHMVLGKDGWRTLVVRPSQGAEVIRLLSSTSSAASPKSGADGALDADEHVGTVVVVDQLEELLRLEESERDAFCGALASLVEGSAAVQVAGHIFEPTDAVRVIATCRDDLFGQVASIPALRRFPERNLFTVRGVEPNAMSSIVEAPARAAGYRLEDGAAVVTEAVRIVRQDPGALPLVQFALTRWWDARDVSAKVLPASVWRDIGGIEGALAEAAQTLYDGFSELERDRMRALLLAMFRPDGTRVRVAETTVVTDAASRAVLSMLVQRRLVTRHTDDTHDDASAGGAPPAKVTLEVVHEALGRRWPLLHTWLEETRSEREILHDLTYDEGRWKQAGKPEDLLWRGARLEAAVELRTRRVVGLERGGEFLDTSVAAEGKQTWRRRGFAGLLAAVVAVAVVMVLSYLGSNRERQRARDQQSIAETERSKAEKSRSDAEEALARNIGLRQDAERAGREALDEKTRADAARLAAVAAREQAQAEAAKNDELRQAAEASQREAQQAMRQAQAERTEADRQRQLNREAAQVAEKQRRQAEAQKKYAETAQRLHELARERMERIEADYDKVRAERKVLDRKLRQCVRGLQ